jgi:hypothetical protein
MLNKLFLKTLFTLSFVLAVSNTANATLITQDILFDSFETADEIYESIGYISIDTDSAIINDIYNDGSLMLGTVSAWVDFELFGLTFWTEEESNAALEPLILPFYFEAIFDTNNLAAGLEFLTFDLNETLYNEYAFSSTTDLFGINYPFSIFNEAGELLLEAGYLAFGDAKLTTVPEPTSLLLFLAAAIGLTTRRKVK